MFAHSLWLYSILTALLVLTISACARPGAPSTMVLREESTGIAVLGEGEAEAPPDTAAFQVGVEVRRPTVAEAREQSAQVSTRLIEALRAAGVEPDGIQTARLSIHPDYEYTDRGRRLLGYVATNTVRVRTRALDQVGQMIDAAVAASGDEARLEGLQFELQDDEAVRAEARARAIAKATATAEQLASLSGVRLGPPIAIEELGGGGEGPVMMARMEMAQADTATPIEPGTTRAQVQVRVRFAIAR